MGDAPVIITGCGGSGTRGVVQVLSGQCYFGECFSDGEPWAFEPVRKSPGFAREMAVGNPLVLSEIRARVAHQFSGFDFSSLWGMKLPMFAYGLWAVFVLWPNAKLIHVVRDGRDFVWTPNTYEGLDRYVGIFYREIPETRVGKLAALWVAVNDRISAWGEFLGARYLRVEYEEFCRSPLDVLPRIAEFVGCGELSGDGVRPSAGIGRWVGRPYPQCLEKFYD